MEAEVKTSIIFDPYPKQKEFVKAALSKKYRVVLYGGAIRGGKTWAGLGTLLLLCNLYPGSIWAVVRNTLPTLKQTTIKSFTKMIQTGSFIKKYNQDTQTVTMKNGSQIIFFSENFEDDKELNRWKGLEVSGFLLEECNELQEQSFYKALERSGSFIPAKGKKPAPLILMTCNPANNWVKKLFYDRWKDGTLPETWLYIPAKITDNPAMLNDPEFIEQLKTMPAYQYQVYVDGDWDVQLKIGGEYLKCFELDQHVFDEELCAYDPALPIHMSWDDNVNPYLPCGLFQIKITPVVEGTKTVQYFDVNMIDEIAGVTPLNNVAKVCAEFIRRYPNHQSGLFVYGDATANKEDTKLEKGFNFYRLIIDGLSRYKPTNKVMNHNPAVVMRANWLNTVLEKEVGRIKIRVSKKCKLSINDFILLKEDENGGKFKEMATNPSTKARYQKVGHFTDLLEYFMISRFANEFAAWQAGGVVGSMRIGKNAPSKHSY